MVRSEKPALGMERGGAGCPREAVGLFWSVERGWSVLSEAAGHHRLLGFPPAFQIALGAAALLREAPHDLLGWPGVCAHERDADCRRAHGAQFRPEPISPARDPGGKGDGDAELWEQGECLCELNSDLNFPTRCECAAPAVGLQAHL